MTSNDLPERSTGNSSWDAATLAAMGVHIQRPRRKIEYRNGWAIIGAVVVAGATIEIEPRVGVTAEHRARLLATAVQIWLYGRNVLQGWSFHRDLGWMVRVGAHFSGEFFSLRESNSATSSSDTGKPLVCVGSSRPLGR